MADVCLAWDEREGREVAIKVIKSDVLDQKSLNSFLKEASQVVGWRHPNILPVYEDMKLQLLDAQLGSIVPYIVMECARGGDLQRRLTAARPYPLGETLRIFAQLCSAVQYAHENGVIHRDLKPLNILFRLLPGGKEQVVLSDFGLSVHVDSTHHTFSQAGTLEYMAPEQFRGHVEPASDIFALGVILYQMCTGRVPFRRSLIDLKHIGVQKLPPLPSSINPSIPASLDDVIVAAFAEDPMQRYGSAAEFWQSVRAAVLKPLQKGAPATKPMVSVRGQSRLAFEGHVPGESAFDVFEPLAKVTRKIPVLDLRDHTTNKIAVPEVLDRTAGFVPVLDAEVSVLKVGAAQTNSLQENVGIGAAEAEAPQITGRATAIAVATIDGAFKDAKRRALQRSRQPFFVLITTLIMLLLLVLAGIAADVYGKIGPFARHASGASSLSTVVITPLSKDLENIYVIDAVIGVPDSSQQQVAARQLASSSLPQSTTVKATGAGHLPGARATGTLTFSNTTNTEVTVAAGKTFSDAHGVQVTNDAAVTIPPASGSAPGQANVPAHAVDAGTNGDILASDIAQNCCAPGVSVKNNDRFTHGQNAQDYSVVQQSDIDGAANALETSLSKNAQTALQNQLASNERFISPAQCSSNVLSDTPVGGKTVNVSVTVTVLCKAEVYDQKAAQSIVAALLTHEAQANLGAHYVLVGDVVAVVTQAAVIDTNQEKTTLLVKADGVWAYHFSSDEQRNLASLIHGKTKQGAENILLKQAGIAKIAFQFASDDKSTLPIDPSQIKIVIQSVVGGRESLSPMTIPGSHP